MTWLRVSPSNAVLKVACIAVAVLVIAACGSAAEGPETARALIEKGAALYAANCSRCHGFDKGGQLRDIPPPHNANGHTYHHPDQQLMDMVLNGIDFAVEGQPRMPPFKETLSEADVRAILAYIKTWWTDDQRSFQATVTVQASQ